MFSTFRNARQSSSSLFGAGSPGAALATAASALAVAALAAGCGGTSSNKDKPATQVAVKVNKEEVSVHQINFVLQQQRGLKPEQADAAGKQILERLIDQELAVQKAQGLKLDRDPRVVQQLEAARREIIARAYLEKAGEAAPRPSAEEVKQYYSAKPALFKDRRVYSLQEIAIEARPEQLEGLRSKLTAAKTVNEFVDHLKANSFNFAGNQAVRPAEQLPLNMLDNIARLKDGQAMLVPSANGAQVLVLVGSRPEPVDEARAAPAIEQYLLNDAKRKVVEGDIKALRSTAQIKYVGKFADAAAAPAPTAATAIAPAISPATSPATALAPALAPAPAPAATATATTTAVAIPSSTAPAAAAGGLNADVISKGMGLKQ